MIHIDQVRTLEIKVKQAVQLVVHLRRENDHLRSRLADTEVRIQEMEELLAALKSAQTQMEIGIQSALNDLGQIDTSSPVVENEGDLTQNPVMDASPVETQAVYEPIEDSFEPEAFELPSHEADSYEVQASPEVQVPDEVVATPQEREIEQPGLGIF